MSIILKSNSENSKQIHVFHAKFCESCTRAHKPRMFRKYTSNKGPEVIKQAKSMKNLNASHFMCNSVGMKAKFIQTC